MPAGLTVEIDGVGAGELPTDESHLVVRAFRAACAELGWTPPGLRVSARNAIPQGRGMGSSAAAVVAGVLAAWALCPDVDAVDGDAVLRLATELEGHPDNVAACLLGGLTLSWIGRAAARAPSGLPVHADVRPVVLVPDAHAVHAGGPRPAAGRRAARRRRVQRRSVRAARARPDLRDLLLEATEDRLHQRQRDRGDAGVAGPGRPSPRHRARRRRLRRRARSWCSPAAARTTTARCGHLEVGSPRAGRCCRSTSMPPGPRRPSDRQVSSR